MKSCHVHGGLLAVVSQRLRERKMRTSRRRLTTKTRRTKTKKTTIRIRTYHASSDFVACLPISDTMKQSLKAIGLQRTMSRLVSAEPK